MTKNKVFGIRIDPRIIMFAFIRMYSILDVVFGVLDWVFLGLDGVFLGFRWGIRWGIDGVLECIAF